MYTCWKNHITLPILDVSNKRSVTETHIPRRLIPLRGLGRRTIGLKLLLQRFHSKHLKLNTQ